MPADGAPAGVPELRGPFWFGSPTVAGRTVELPYAIGTDASFVERVAFPFDLPDTAEVRVAVRALHLIAGVSYYKCVAPTPLEVPALSDVERAVVVALYDQGLREFAYRNDIGVPLPVDLVEREEAGAAGAAVAEGSGVPGSGSGVGGAGGALVPIGGGKDSALVASLVPEGRLFAVNPVGAHEHLAATLGRPLVRVRRTLDPRLRALVEQGVPNGHVPVTAITSAIAVVAAAALGVADVVMGIERSADEPSLVTPDGVPVNHQFSKSHEAEVLLREVFAPTGVRYFSLLRPLTELAIGAAVAGRGLAADIVSCNRVFTVWNETTASREQRPCGECAKCLFTALMLAPSSSPAAIEAHFGRALLDEADHVEAVRELWSDAKPFDCVGERLESAAAVELLARSEGWRDQAVVSALAGEARSVLTEAGVRPESFLEVGPLEDLPPGYREAVAGLAEALRSVPGLHHAAR